MEKNKLVIIPLSIGIIFIISSWYSSYPLAIDNLSDLMFNHVSVLYWFGLPLVLVSMYIIAVTFKSNYWKWLAALGIVIAIYSLSYFYYMLPGSDSHYFRGYTEYFVRTKNFDSSQLNHRYFQWPSLFLLSDMLTSVSGLKLASFEFLLYAIIGFLFATTLYLYASKASKNGGFFAVLAFFVSMFYFLNYQFAPFSLALGLLFLIFVLESHQKSVGSEIAMVLLFVGISFAHAFVGLFLVLYLLVRLLLRPAGHHVRLFLLTSLIYLFVQITQAQLFFGDSLRSLTAWHTEYSSIAEATLAGPSTSIDVVVQMLSRTVTISIITISIAGFVLLLVSRKLSDLSKAILITGAVYSVLGSAFFVLGSRAIPLVLIPISLGASYLVESKIGSYVKIAFLVLLVLFVFVPIHTSLSGSQITFQTREAYTTANFMLEKYGWNTYSTILSDVGTKWYLFPQINGNSVIETDCSSSASSNLQTYDCVIYSVGLAQSCLRNNVSEQEALEQMLNRFNVIYDSGFSFIAKIT